MAGKYLRSSAFAFVTVKIPVATLLQQFRADGVADRLM